MNNTKDQQTNYKSNEETFDLDDRVLKGQESLERCYGFDLHGCIIFDAFIPLSFCPSKGIKAPLILFPKFIFEKTKYTEWCEEVQLLTAPKNKPYVCIIEAHIPERCLLKLTHLDTIPEKKIATTIDTAKQSLIKMAEKALELRASRNTRISLAALEDINNNNDNKLTDSESNNSSEKSSPSSTKKKSTGKLLKRTLAKATSKVINSVLKIRKNENISKEPPLSSHHNIERDLSAQENQQEQQYSEASKSLNHINDNVCAEQKQVDNEYVKDESGTEDTINTCSADEYAPSTEVAHVAGFFQELEKQLDPPEHEGFIQSCLQGLQHMMTFVETLEFCAGCVIFVKIPDNIDTTRINVPYHIPKNFRKQLKVPTIFCQHHSKDYTDIMSCIKYSDQRNNVEAPVSHDAVITPIPLKRGDHIYREMRNKGALKLIEHHGIYTGHGRIIHFSGNEMSLKGLLGGGKNAKIRSVSILTFMKKGSRLRVKKYKKSDNIPQVIERAEEALTMQSFPDYNLFKNNCEHFCYYCKTGKSRSKQVEKGIVYATAVGTAVVAAAVVGAALLRKHA